MAGTVVLKKVIIFYLWLCNYQFNLFFHLDKNGFKKVYILGR